MTDETDLVFIVWANTKTSQGRPFETMTKHGSRLPVAWRLSFLQTKYAALYAQTHLVPFEEDLSTWMSPPYSLTVTRERPLLVPVQYARNVLGWNEYTVWEDEDQIPDD